MAAEQAPGGRRRRRRRDRPRGYTVAQRRLSLEQLRIGARLYPPIEPEVERERPRTRADCIGAEGPCPWVACKHNLYLDVNPETGSIKINFPDLEPWEMADTCALDVADRGGITLEEVGEIMNLTREQIRQVEVRGLLKLKMASPSPEELGALAGAPVERRRRKVGKLRDPVPGEELYGWTVVEEAPSTARGKRQVRVRCRCGGVRVYYWSRLLSGQVSASCSSCSERGGRRTEPLRPPVPGEQIHSWTILGLAEVEARVRARGAHVRVRCACGAEGVKLWAPLLGPRAVRSCRACANRRRREESAG